MKKSTKITELGSSLFEETTKIVRTLEKHKYNDKVLYIAQECLMDRLLAIEKQTIDFREEARKLRRETEKLRSGAEKLNISTKTKIQELDSKAKNLDTKRKELKYGKWLLRYIGDGIAWHAYRHSRNHIRALSDKDPINSIGKPEKFIYHRRLFRGFRHIGKNFLPVMHDITNCLRVGDLTVFNRGQWFKLFEWKIIGPDGEKSIEQTLREKRQALRLGRLRAYFETNQINYLSAEYPRSSKFIKVDIQEKYHFDLMSRIISQARKQIIAFENPEKGLYYYSYNPNFISKTDALLELNKTYPEAFESHFMQKTIAPFEHKDPASLPVTAMFLSAEDQMDIIFGNICIGILLNFKQMEELCNEKGIPLKVRVTRGRGASFITNRAPKREVTSRLWHRIFMEGLSLETFILLLQRAPKNRGANVEGWISHQRIEKYDPLPLFEKIGFHTTLYWVELKVNLIEILRSIRQK